MKLKQEFSYLPDGSLNLPDWVAKMNTQYHLSQPDLLQKAADTFYQLATEPPSSAKADLERGLATAGIILELNLGEEAAAAAILCTTPILTRTHEELIKKQMGETIAKLAIDVKKTDIIPLLLKQQQIRDMGQLDKMRKMLLAMATDIRVVIIKLAERLCFLQSIKHLSATERKHNAQEVMDIYAPLANRLGIGQLKWELEDIAFHYLDPATYKTIANFLAERRVDREKRIHQLMDTLREKLREANIKAEVSGRPKHIYSIYLKASRKAVSYQEIYDHSAFRILVNTIEECYQALSLVNSLWPPITEEFDDYIANPKPNGYRSIHTAVIGEDGKHFEIQIRTHDMHDEAERGVAAHWMYKEKAVQPQPLDDAAKINYLRQLFDWQKEVAIHGQHVHENSIEDNNIYVITPAGDIQDLPKGATPLDFAYHIHTELGHRCRGAKVNKQIVPLTHELKTGDKVEIITVLQGSPSRDWLNQELGYIKTSRARSKISHWFKQQALDHDVAEGKQILEKEFARHGITQNIALNVIARYFNLKNEEALLASLGRGNIRIGQILQSLQPKTDEKNSSLPAFTTQKKPSTNSTAILDADDVLTRFALCCKPIPGDEIVGYITQGRGISIHKKNCSNINSRINSERLMTLTWNKQPTGRFTTDLKIIAQDKHGMLNDLTALLANEKISLLNLNTTFNRSQNRIVIAISIYIENSEQLGSLLHRIQQLPGIIEVHRTTSA